MIEENEDHVAEILELPIDEIVVDKPRVISFLTVVGEQIQALERANMGIVLELSIDVAIGAQLDLLGRIVGEQRRGAGDEPYRNRIRVRVLINRSNGRIPEVLEILRLFEGWGATELNAHLYQVAAMQLVLSFWTMPTNTIEELRILLRAIKGAGVGLDLVLSPAPHFESFRFTWSGFAPVVEPGLGFSWSGGGIAGGVLAYAESI